MEQKHQQFTVGVKGVVHHNDTVLILRCAEENMWELPGGRINEAEDIAGALERELSEELGMGHVKPDTLLYSQLGAHRPAASCQLLLLFYSTTTTDPTPVSLSHEHRDYHWLAPCELGDYPLFLSDKTAIQLFFDIRASNHTSHTNRSQ